MDFTQKANGREYLHYRCKACLIGHLKCASCEKIKPKSHFHKDAHEKRGHKYDCKVCRGFGKEATTYFSNNKEEIYAWRKAKSKTDPMFHLSNTLRTRMWIALQAKKWRKNSNFSKYLGCTLEEFKKHIESQFQPGMNWDNYGLKGWHVDHIVPLANANNNTELYELFHYTNLQPLWASENLKKGRRQSY